MQNMVVTTREVFARRVPQGNPETIPEGQFVSIKQSLGGNYTITHHGNMYRIDGTDADALGKEAEVLDFQDSGCDQIIEDQVYQALRTIFDPEIPINLVDLGLIYGVDIDQHTGSVSVQMTLTAPTCGMGPVLIGDVEYRVGKVPKVHSVKVELVFDPAWHKDMMTEEAQLEAGLFF